jgi:hypothetical protein
MFRIFFLHHKCGTQYILQIVQKVSEQMGIPIFLNECQPDGISVFENSDYFHFEELEIFDFKGVHIIRDPRDIIVSGYFSHKFSHSLDSKWGQKFLKPRRELLHELSLEDGINIEIETGYSLKELSYWKYHQPNILEIKFEEIIINPVLKFEEIFNFIELEGLDFGKITDEINFTTLSEGRNPGEEVITSHYRKGIPGDWVNYFSDRNKDYFKKTWPGLIQKLKYDKDDHW